MEKLKQRTIWTNWEHVSSYFYRNSSNNYLYIPEGIMIIVLDYFTTSCSNNGRRHSGCECVSPGLSPSRLSAFLRRVLVLVGSSGACWRGPNVAFFPFLPNSFSTSKKIQHQSRFNKQLNMTIDILTPTSKGALDIKRKQHWPSEMLDSWNMVSKAWCVSAKDGRSEGFHLQPDRKTGNRILKKSFQ